MSKAGFSKKVRVYVPRSRKEEQNPPLFHLRRLTPLEVLDISERFSDAGETIELGGIEDGTEKDKGTVKINLRTVNKMIKTKYAVLELALSGWERVEDEDGEVLPFSKENVQYLDPDIVSEMAEIAQGSLSGEEVKNSESPS